MAHSHNHSNAEKNISTAFYLNAFFVVIEVIGGLMTNSIAILTDALHDFGDCLSLGSAWALQKKSTKGRDSKYSYGYKRFSLLSSIFLSGVLTLSSVFVLIEACKRVMTPQNVSAQGMLWMAILGIIINGAAAFRVKTGNSLSERSVFLHIMEDVLGWVGVLGASIVMMFVNFPAIDPILSILISIWVLTNVWNNLKSVFKVLLQAVPDNVSIEKLTADLLTINDVESVHDIHVWSLDGESHVLTLHVVTESTTIEEIKQDIANIASNYNITHVTTEIERPGTECHVEDLE
ncbi:MULTISPECIES: cation diffusion facilitator family transporter [Bacteroidales]|uniref:cation diffusion facilitator family transporter n=1 Tax=Prevotella heparinolytica TaxID=28113 RepID=UPI002A841520|nr:cation diffusion facilitator family transporter [Prevotella sp.]MDY4020104.1 cation diffusion facilitator family transporter [Prevotella sp.]